MLNFLLFTSSSNTTLVLVLTPSQSQGNQFGFLHENIKNLTFAKLYTIL